jgi:hypothetical protein
MAYGELKVDSITFTNGGTDTTVSVSGLVQNPTFSGDITVTGTISGSVVQGGVTVSGATVTGTAGEFSTVTGNTAGFTTVTGTTVTGTTVSFTSGVFTNISGGTYTITSGVFDAGTVAAPSIVFTGNLDTGIYSPSADQLAISISGTQRMIITSGGFLKVSNNGTYISVPSPYHELINTAPSGAVLAANASSFSYSSTVYFANVSRSPTAAYSFFQAYSANFTDKEFDLYGDGNGKCDGAWTGGGADYAEYFEWSDGNPDNEDRRGISVVLDGEKISPAVTGEDPIGVISVNPSVVGDAAWNKWSGKYLRDEFGAYILEDYEVTDDDGNTVTQQRRKLNPVYDPDMEYISREDRPEWACVGLMGKLRIRKGQPTGSRWIKMRDISESVEEWLVR